MSSSAKLIIVDSVRCFSAPIHLIGVIRSLLVDSVSLNHAERGGGREESFQAEPVHPEECPRYSVSVRARPRCTAMPTAVSVLSSEAPLLAPQPCRLAVGGDVAR